MPRTEDDASQPTLRRLSASDVDMAKAAFRLMAEVFGERIDVLTDAHVDDLHALDFYRALGAKADPVTMFSFNATPH
jgi:hypothetical protein